MTICPAFQRAAPFPRLRVPLPLFAVEVRAGFPSPADDHLEGQFDLNELFVSNPTDTFMVRAKGGPLQVSRHHRALGTPLFTHCCQRM